MYTHFCLRVAAPVTSLSCAGLGPSGMLVWGGFDGEHCCGDLIVISSGAACALNTCQECCPAKSARVLYNHMLGLHLWCHTPLQLNVIEQHAYCTSGNSAFVANIWLIRVQLTCSWMCSQQMAQLGQ